MAEEAKESMDAVVGAGEPEKELKVQINKIAKEYGPLAIFGISLGGVIFSIYLTYLELYVIHAVCPFCVASAIIIILLFILAILRLVKQTTY